MATMQVHPAAASGYVLDAPYTAEYFDDMHPARLYLAALINGHAAAFDPDRPGYCELGCGNGMTLTLLAAALPEGEFVGVDFNPGHIARARALARRADLENIRFIEADFASADEALAGKAFDIVAAHGVYSWVDEDARCALERFVDRHLAAGGLFHVSYNALPRWAAAEPARKLLHEFMDQRPDPSDAALDRALQAYDALRGTGVGWFDGPGPTVDHLLDPARRDNAAWLAYAVHEYGGEHWRAWYHCDVRRRLERGALMGYVGTTDFARAWPDAGGTQALEERLAAIDDPGLRETLRDYVVQPLLRQDIYARGRMTRSGGARQRLLDGRRVALMVDPETVETGIDLPVGRVRLDEDRLARLIACLRESGVATIGELVTAMEAGDETEASTCRRLVLLLCRARVLQPVPAADAVAQAPAAARFNEAAMEWARDRTPCGALLAPALGIGCPAGSLGQLVWCALGAGVPAEAEALGDHLLDTHGLRIRSSASAGDSADDRSAIREAVARVLDDELPRLRRVVGEPLADSTKAP